ncbi:MAG: hypothetical protein ABFR82_00230 [Nitrospirota bacterium]
MNKKNIVIGVICIFIAIWIYAALSVLKVEEGSDPERLIIREGIVRTYEELADALAEGMDFDLESAYKEGYSSRDAVNYLLRKPHKYSITLYKNRFYEGRITIPYIMPFLTCILFFILGTALLITEAGKWKSGKAKK